MKNKSSSGVNWITSLMQYKSKGDPSIFITLYGRVGHYLEYCLYYYTHQSREVKIAREGGSRNNLEQEKC